MKTLRHELPHGSHPQPLPPSVKRPKRTLKLDCRNLKKSRENINALIEGWCKKKLVFALPLLPFGTVREANAHCTHLQIAHANPQSKICKRVQF
jgi:hypothetical protein